MSLFSRGAPSFLPDRDYLPLAMPSAGVDVLDVLSLAGGALHRYSSLGSVLLCDENVPFPKPGRDVSVASAEGFSRRRAKLGIGLSVTSQILRALGSSARVKMDAKGVSAVEYAYSDVTTRAIDIADLDKWLASADFDPSLRVSSDLLAAERLYVITAVLRARALTVTFLDDKDCAVALDISTIIDSADATSVLNVNVESKGSVTFSGRKALCVAVKACRIGMDSHGFFIGTTPRNRGEVRGALNWSETYLSGSDIDVSAITLVESDV